MSAPISIPTSFGPHADGNQCDAILAPTGQLPGNYCYFSPDVSKQISNKCCAKFVSEPVRTDGSGCYDYCSFGNNLLLMGNPMEQYQDCMSEAMAEVSCITKQPPSHSDFAPDTSATAPPTDSASATAASATSTASLLPPGATVPGTCPTDYMGSLEGWTPDSYCYTSVDVPQEKMRQCCSKITSGLVRSDGSGCYNFCPMDDGLFHSKSKFDQMNDEWSQCMRDANALVSCQQNRIVQPDGTTAMPLPTTTVLPVTLSTAMSATATSTAGGQDNAAGKIVGSGRSLKAMGAVLGAAVVFGLQL